jgi:tetratricopeptide (TPR) repeat protein
MTTSSKSRFITAFGMAIAMAMLLAGSVPAARAQNQVPQVAAQEIAAEPDITLFSIMTALNAAGYDAGMDRPELTPVRAAVRRELEGKDYPSLTALREFYKAHRLADPARDLSRYVSLSLVLGPPPKFDVLYSPVNLPPDVLELLDARDEGGKQAQLPVLLSAFYEQADVSSLWVKYLPAMNQDAEKYQVLLTKMIQETSGYLGIESGVYLGRKFSLMLNPLAGPGRTESRNYGDGYYLIVGPPQQGALPEDDIQHAWLHYLLDPYVSKYPNIVQAKSPLLRIAAKAPGLDPAFKTSFDLLMTESLIRAIQARRAKGTDREKLALAQEAVEEGYILTAYFYDALQVFEKQPVGFNLYFQEMIDGIQLDKEQKLLAEVHFRPASTMARAETRWSPLEQMAREAELAMARGEYDQARDGFNKLIDLYGMQPRFIYGLAIVASQQKQPEQAAGYFAETARRASDPRMRAWAHIYLGRLYDGNNQRKEAVAEYEAALSSGDVSPDTRTAAEQGLKTPFVNPKAAAETSGEPPRARVPMGRDADASTPAQ